MSSQGPAKRYIEYCVTDNIIVLIQPHPIQHLICYTP